MKNNPVFQVLVVSNATLLAKDGALTSLAVGQLGVFDAYTHLALDDAAALSDKFYFAVGLPDATGSALGDVRKSAGEFIEKALLNHVNSESYAAGSNQVISLDLTGFDPQYATDYVARFEFQSGQTMNLNGFQNPIKSFTYSTPSTSSGSYTLSTFITNFVAEVNKDEEGLIVAADAGSNVITFTIGSEDKTYVINGVNRRYNALREFNVKYGFSAGFEDDDYSVSSTGPVYESGSGYDIQQMEYVAGGWIGNPGVYRDSMLHGIYGAQIKTYAVEGTEYWTMRFNYNRKYTSGGTLQYESELETVIAIPQTATYFTLINELITMVNTYLSNPGITNPVTTTTTTSSTTTTTTTGA